MIPIDPVDVLGHGIWEAVKRAFAFLGSLILGSIFAILSAFAAYFLLSLTPLHSSVVPSLGISGFGVLPFLTSIFALVALPNAFIAGFYYIRSEDISPKRFFLFASIQQICLTGAFNQWAFDSNDLLVSILGSLLLWFFSLSLLALLFFANFFLKNKERCGHEEHLMAVSVENEIWRQKVANAEIIPPPPSGPNSPKARPLR